MMRKLDKLDKLEEEEKEGVSRLDFKLDF